IIPDTAKEKPHEGQVVAVGAGKVEKGKRVPVDVKVGDRILFGKYTGNDITIDDQEYLILREEEILAKISGIAKAASGRKESRRSDFAVVWAKGGGVGGSCFQANILRV